MQSIGESDPPWIKAATITGAKIAAGTIEASNIKAGTITSDKLNVNTLSAITANIGTITTGTIGGWIIDSNGIRSQRSNVTTQALLWLYSQAGISGITMELNGSTVFNLSNRGIVTAAGLQTSAIDILNGGGISGTNNNLYIISSGTINITSGGYIYTNDSIAMTKTSTATTGLRVKNTKLSDYIFFGVNSDGTRGIYDYGLGTWVLGMNASNQVYSKYIYTLTTTGSANVNVASNGVLRRHASSSQRYKHDIHYYSNESNAVSDEKKRSALKRNEEDLLSILKLPVCSFLYNQGYISDDVGYDPKRPVYGFIAEDVQNVSPDAVDYLETSNGEIPESWDVKKLFPKVVYVVQKHEDEMNQYRQVLFLLYEAVKQAGLLDAVMQNQIVQSLGRYAEERDVE